MTPTPTAPLTSVLSIPEPFREVLEGATPDALSDAVRQIATLPKSFLVKLDQYSEIDRLEDLRDFSAGLLKLRQGILPAHNELLIIACPHTMLTQIAVGIEKTARYEGACEAAAAEIVGLLRAAVKLLEWPASRFVIRDWAEDLVDTHYSDLADEGAL